MRIVTIKKVTRLFYAALILFVMSLVLGLLGWTVGGSLGLLWALCLGSLVLVFSSKLSTDRMLSVYEAVPLMNSQFAALHSAVDTLAARADLPTKPGLFYVPSKIPNAFAIGNKRQPAVVVTAGLLTTLNLREIVGVIAHEISHIKHNDMWLLRLADILSRLTVWISIMGQLLLFINFPLLFLGKQPIPWLFVMLLIASPTVSKLLELALARSREFDADLDGVAISGDPLGLASALRKIKTNDSGFVGKVLGKRQNPDRFSLWRSHPETNERIERILSVNQRELKEIYPEPTYHDILRRGSRWCLAAGC